MAEPRRIRGENWFAWYSEPDGQWLLKYRVKVGTWRMHRVPGAVQDDGDAKRYGKIFVRARTEKVPAAALPETNGAVAISPDMTFKQLGDLWTGGKLSALYPRYVKLKKSARADAGRLRIYAYEHIGHLPIRDFEAPRGLELAESVMAALPPPTELSNGSARQIGQVVHRVLALAVYPLRILPAHPLPRGFLPRLGEDKAKTYIYPDEDAKLLACKDVPLLERLFYGFLTREGCRVGEVRGVQLYEFDLDHGWGHLDETKNGRSKDWPLQPGTIEALVRYRDRFIRPSSPNDHVFAQADGSLLDPYLLAERLRRHLKTAGVTRAQLHLQNKNRLRLRAHDLRASFVTVALGNGKTESWVADRTGHLSSQMINRYKRWARGHLEQNLGDWVPLHHAIPELSDDQVASKPTSSPGSRDEVPASAETPSA